MARCEAGACSVECGSPGAGCACISWGDTSEECACFCSPRGFVIVNERKIPFNRFKPGIKITSQTKFNICTHGLPITGLAELLDKFLPNKILVPVDRLNKKVTLSLKNKTFKQIINS